MKWPSHHVNAIRNQKVIPVLKLAPVRVFPYVSIPVIVLENNSFTFVCIHETLWLRPAQSLVRKTTGLEKSHSGICCYGVRGSVSDFFLNWFACYNIIHDYFSQNVFLVCIQINIFIIAEMVAQICKSVIYLVAMLRKTRLIFYSHSLALFPMELSSK